MMRDSLALDSPPPPSRPARWRLSPRTIAGLVAVVLLVAFVLQNRRPAAITFYFWDVHTGLIWALLVSAALGFLLGLATGWRRRRRS